MTKRDLKRELACYRARRDTPQLLDVPDLQYLMIDGHGDPNTQVYTHAVEALYPVAYALKFAGKQVGRDHVVMPLEGLWWADDMSTFTTARDKTAWDWTMMIMVPEWVTPELFDDAVARVTARSRPARLGDLRLETLAEGRCVQALHIGPYDDEAPLLRHIHHDFIPAHGLAPAGKHHEIYLGDPRRTAPARLRTILRQPVTDAPPRR
ncbi:GyrI-like domain-containing protein [Pseudonocardia ailaonensis]|uniref:GyrI-like domain-containing protein n=1 Tax=Pseudonocardia ailaonensis TaxID=367279 RepID=A0ABN2NMD3_9PSEU